ncbi:MAG: hypothetical protein GTO71_03585 [Woeseiaceae bacterium]|nr:hypothetical protein [Woeseiaceae bacterium]NIP20192.1 hypothetical protein [Woeseiaceae bacterium]NIS88988.1 hypothetical protein [Woeseiaceae bacterium]
MTRSILLALILPALAAVADEVGRDIHVDIGEVVESGEVVPVDGITSAGQPNEAALKVFADSGYAVVIDMRGADEDRGMEDFQGAVEATGMEYVAFPVVGKEAINFDTARQLDELLRGVDGPVLLHCGSGNRVGAVLALRESLAGADDESAIQFGKDAGLTRLEPVVREVLKDH